MRLARVAFTVVIVIVSSVFDYTLNASAEETSTLWPWQQTTVHDFSTSTGGSQSFHVINTTEGVIKYPTGDGNYGNNEYVQWQINNPSGERYSVHFDRIQLETSYDFVYIYDGPNPSSALLYKTSANTQPFENFFSSGRSILIVFTSDGSNVFSGFALHFETRYDYASSSLRTEPTTPAYWWTSTPSTPSAPASTPSTPSYWWTSTNSWYSQGSSTPSSPIFYTLNQTSGAIVHPTSGGSYNNYEDIRWQINTPSGNLLVLYVGSFDLENCCDYVYIYDGPSINSPTIVKLTSGTVSLYHEFVTSGRSALVRFTSDLSVVGKGFSLHFYTAEATSISDECPESTTSSSGSTSGFLGSSTGFPRSTSGSSGTTPDFTRSSFSSTGFPRSTSNFPNPTGTTQNPLPWPRSQDMLGFWPLDLTNGLSDVTGRQRSCSRCHGVPNSNTAGPFGQHSTSYKTGSGGSILDITNARPPTDASFTVSFYINVPASGAVGGILSLGDSRGNYFQLDLANNNESRPTLRVRGATKNAGDIYGVYDVLQPSEWSFVAVVVEKSEWAPCMLSIHGRFGTIYKAVYKAKMCDSLRSATNLQLGFASPEDSLSSSVSISCLSLYSAALSPNEIRQVHDSCRAAHGTPPCGSPIIPYPAVPLNSTTVPKYGQFPWIASLRRKSNPNTIACSAAIIDRFFLLTSASCFKGVNNASDLVVKVGDFDALITEPNEREHSIRKFTAYPLYNESAGDIAIIELETPVDFSDPYISTICLPNPTNVKADTDSSYFFYGWGKNGRTSLISQTSPRYVNGKLVTDQRCSSAWPNEYRPILATCFESSGANTKNVPCGGDEGGPLMVPGTDVLGSNNLQPVGIYFKRNSECTADSPALFTLIAPYMQWITQTVACTLPGYSYPTSCPVNHA